MPFFGDDVFDTTPPVRYLFRECSESSYLLVVFSAYPKQGQPPRYNYLNVLEGTAINQLFILDDYGGNGCYYLGENRDFFVEKNTVALIRTIASERGIDSGHIIAAGSSKGGYAALYFGFRYGFGTVISGGFQSMLGDYLMEYHPDTAVLIAGGVSQEDRMFLNRLLFDVIREANDIPDLYLHMGRGDYHYSQHMIPLLTLFDKQGISYQFDLADYTEHDEVGVYFPEYLQCYLNRII